MPMTYGRPFTRRAPDGGRAPDDKVFVYDTYFTREQHEERRRKRLPPPAPPRRPRDRFAGDDNDEWGGTATTPDGQTLITSRPGSCATVIELKPGLYVVATTRIRDGVAGPADAKAIARDALNVVDQALDTIFPARRAAKEARQAAAKAQRRAERDLDAARKAQAEAERSRRLAALATPGRTAVVTREDADWATDAEDDAEGCL